MSDLVGSPEDRFSSDAAQITFAIALCHGAFHLFGSFAKGKTMLRPSGNSYAMHFKIRKLATLSLETIIVLTLALIIPYITFCNFYSFDANGYLNCFK